MLIKDIFKKIFRNLKTNKYRYILMAISVCVSIVSLIFMSSIGYNIKHDLIKSFNSELNLQAMDIVYNGTNEKLIDDIDLRIADVKKIDGLKNVVYENYMMKVIVKDKTQIDNVIQELQSKEYTVFSNYEELKNIIKILDLVNTVLLILGVTALLIAVVNISNSVSVSINDRKYEIGVMRALGIRFKDLKLLFFLENIIVAISAVIIGVIIKILISPIIDKIFHSNIPFSFSNIASITKLPILNLVLIMCFVLILVSFTIWISLRKLKKIDIAEIVKGD